jgi:hypothetical protein
LSVRQGMANRASTCKPTRTGETRLIHRCYLAWRQRAQGHGLPGSSDPSWAATRAARLASGPSPECAVVCAGHSQACARAASPCPLGATVWKLEAQHETVRWRTNVPCKRCHGSTAGSHTRSSHDDSGHKGISGPGAPLCRGAAVLRRDG